MYGTSINDFYANPVAIADTTSQQTFVDGSKGNSGDVAPGDATPWGAPPFLTTGTIVLIVLAVAAVGGIAWYYFKKR